MVAITVGIEVTLAGAQVQVLSNTSPQTVFAGPGRGITVNLRNRGERPITVNLDARLFQASSATAAKVGETPWKSIEILAGQTILDSVQLDFPPIRGETRFIVQWIADKTNAIGRTEVLAYPEDLLKELKPLAGDDSLGVFDPLNQTKPLLKGVAVEFTDLENAGLEGFSGRLAIVGPFETGKQTREGLSEQIETLAGKGVPVVWIQPPSRGRAKLQPSFYTVTVGKGVVVVVQAELVADLSQRPQSQLNLIQFARLALHPEPVRLPQLTPQP